MKRILWIFITHLFFINIASAQEQFIKHYTVADGLPTDKVFCVYQDSEGFIWFGSDAGVIRYDGKEFQNFSMEDGLSGNNVHSIKEDNTGRLWFFNSNGTLDYYYHNTILNNKNTPFLEDLKTNFFLHNFYQDEDSTLYFYNANSEVLVVKNDELVDYYDFGFSRKRENLIYLNKSTDGKFLLWSDPGIYEFENINDSLIFHPLSLNLQRVFIKNRYESFGLDRYGFISSYFNSEVNGREILHSETQYINSLTEDKDGFFWLATNDKGIYCYKNGKVILHLKLGRINGLIADRENSIWIVSGENGIYKINREILKFTYFEKEVFNDKGITGLALANNGEVWATNGNNLFLVKKNKSFPLMLKIKTEFLDRIYQLKDNTLLANGSSTDLLIIEDLRFDAVTNSFHFGKNGNLQLRVKNISIDDTENFLYSFINNNLIVVNLKNKYKSYVEPLKLGLIHNVFFNCNNKLIINASKSYILKEGTIFPYKILEPFDGQFIKAHLTLNTVNDLYNISGESIYLLNNQILYNLTEKFKYLIDFQIQDMIYYRSSLFFSTSKTVYYISNPLNVINGDSIKFNKLNIEFNNVNGIICRDSILYVGSDDGLTLIPIKECANNLFLPAKPYFNNILLDGKEIDFSSGEIDFRGHKKIGIEYASISYSTLPLKYSYILEGYDKNWTQSNETNVVYQNLPPGFYTFKLQSRKINEDFGNTVELSLNVRPTFFQRKITLIAISLILILVLVLIILYFKNKQLKQKETESLLLSLENKALQSMMNPHFIFNALSSIQSYLLQNKASEAGTYLSQFARLIRQNMNSLKSNFINIEDEVERLRNYLELERFRMEGKFDYTIDVDDQLESDEISIPSMIVQPFAENAIWHGISSLPGDGLINIRFEKKDEKSILVIIEDNGIGITQSSEFPKSGEHLNMGIGLTEKRLKLIGEKVNVKSEIITEELNPGLPNPGTRVILIVPISTDEYRI
jgi:two-component sensor histidine kinase